MIEHQEELVCDWLWSIELIQFGFEGFMLDPEVRFSLLMLYKDIFK